MKSYRDVIIVAATLCTLLAARAGAQPKSIFDIEGFDDQPTTRPAVRERPREYTPPQVISVIPAPAVTRLPVPPAAEITKANQSLNELFAQEIKIVTPAGKRALANKLTKTAAESSNDPPARYVLLCAARDLAASAGDVTLLTHILDMLVQSFDVDELASRAAAVIAAAPAATSPPAAHTLATEAIALLEAALRDDEFPTADKLAPIAEAAAVRAQSRDGIILPRLRSLLADLRTARDQWQKIKPAIDAIKANPAKPDPADLLLIGRYLCFIKGDWKTGLPMLAVGSDAGLKSLAATELAGTADAQAAIASNWWDYAAAQPADLRPKIQEHAAFWYRQASPSLGGLARSLADARIAQTPGLRKLEPGLLTEIFWDPGLRLRQRIRIDPYINADYSFSTPDPTVQGDVFGIRWTGLLKVPKTASYTFVIRVKESCRVWIDGTQAFSCDNPTDAYRKAIKLTEGLHSIRIHYNSHGSKSRIHLGWALEGGFKEQLIPAEAFCHDARAEPEPLRDGSTLAGFPAMIRTARVGGSTGGWFDDLPTDPASLLVGGKFVVAKLNDHHIIKSFQPLYRNESGHIEDGHRHGSPEGDSSTTLPHKDGYVVAAIRAKGGERVMGLSLIFARVRPNGTIDPTDRYESEWVGGQSGTLTTLGNGKPVIGICGHCGSDLDRLGLIEKQ